jgi:hypothetical protein
MPSCALPAVAELNDRGSNMVTLRTAEQPMLQYATSSHALAKRQEYVDIAPSCIGVRAGLMCEMHQLLRGGSFNTG